MMFHMQMHRLPCMFFYVVSVISLLTFAAHAQHETNKPIMNEPQESGASKLKLDEELFKRLFAQRRKDHLEVVQTLLKIDSYERLYKMIMILTEKVVEVIESSKDVIEKIGFIPDSNSFPADNNIKDALSSILENTVLFGDVILHLPDITHRILKTQQKWNSIIHWSLNFVDQTQHLLDKSTLKMIHLVKQEMNITERESNYSNPYRSTSVNNRGNTAKKKPATRDKRKRGPQIAKVEL